MYVQKKSFFKQSIVRHIEIHHKQGQATVLVIGCPQCKDEILHNTCDSVMDARGKYENHIDPIKARKSRTPNFPTENSNLKDYNCKLCKFVGHSHKIMMIHIKTYHQNNKLFDCDSSVSTNVTG